MEQQKYQKRILFFGMPDMAIVCLSKLVVDGFNIVGVVPPHRSEDTYDLMCNITKSMRKRHVNTTLVRVDTYIYYRINKRQT